ncbi:rho GTPase-activating protein 20 [Gracilinanus agilis]|uniref:rho GTPase-activating protein 20 n=1 Tax=Gracilinanus agilis TaxID=191870 RepID=UPI001CFF32C4|nr:rho GTPase-activating protein 20 [Gracilinanus agilis]
MEAMSPQQETLGGQPGRSSSLTGESRIVGDTESKKKMKTLAERRRSAPSLILDKALQKRPSSKESPSANLDPCTFLTSFMGSNRTLLIDGRVELKRGLQRQERHLFLFNDLFVVAKIKYNNNLKIKNKIKLSDMWTASCVDEVGEGNTNTMKSFVLGWPTVNFVATFSSPEQKDKWLSLLQRYIEQEKEKDHPKSIPLKIFAKDIGNCAYSKTITITNSDTVNEVIVMALPMLGINGSERDYQLWVNSGREEAPYPLIDPSQKMFKRRRSIINWAFWRGSSTHLDNMPMSPTSPMPGQLFGVSLPEICENDNLPKPVLDMLFFLNQKGPLTKGIFRQSANVKSCRELKEKLNSGAEVHLDCESIFVTASVLKVELEMMTVRKIRVKCCINKEPGVDGSVHSVKDKSCPFDSERYPIWGFRPGYRRQPVLRHRCQSRKHAISEARRSIVFSRWLGSPEDRSGALFQAYHSHSTLRACLVLIEQLPRANVVLLRYLFGVLHSIEQQSASNQMTAFNLAVCIAPSILWPPSSASPELENEFTKKVSLLVQFLIENCCRIFGEEITSLLGDISISCDRDNAPGISCFQLNDSSYDSLENELNDDVDAPCSDLVKKLGQDSRSMDSVLTLSDCDLDQPESEGILTLSDFDLDQPKNEEIQLKHPSKSKPLSISVASYSKVSAQVHSKNISVGTRTSGFLSTAAGDALKNWRRHRRCSEPSIDYLDSKLTYLREFYQKKLRKSSCDAILSHRDEDGHKQPHPSQGGDQKLINPTSVIQTEVEKKNTTNQNVKKKGFFSHEGTPVKLPFKSKSITISVASYSNISLQDHSKSQTFGTDPSGYSPSNTALGLKSLQRHRRCSEPNIDYLDCKLTSLRGVSPKNLHKTSCDVGLSLGDEDYLKRHQSLQVEGQKLINQSLVMGIEVGKSNTSNQNMEKMLPVTPPRLNICSRTSYSSLSSPGTSPSGSSVSSQDSAFSQISEHSVFIPTETSSPVDCTFSTSRKQGELSPDFCSPFSGMPNPSPGPASSHPLCIKKDNIEWASQMHSVTIHPSTWLRNGVATLKNWSLKKKTKASRQERKKVNSLKGTLEQPTCSSEVSEAGLLPEALVDAPLRPSNLVSAVEADEQCHPYGRQDSADQCSSQFSSLDNRFKLQMKPAKEVEDDSQRSPGAPPPENPSLCYPLTLENTLNPAPDAECPETAVVCSDEFGHRTKDI